MNARPLSAALLRRLGEAADGYRTGRPIYVVACYDDPRNDLRVFERESDAVEHLARAGERFGMFGPFATPVDGSASGSPVREVAVTLRAPDGGERVVRLDGAKYDSFFWSASAIDKFAVPYYAATSGIGVATEMRRRAMQGPVCGLIHMPTSEWMPDIFDGYGAPGDPEVAMEVAMVTLILHDGREMRIDGREHDAVFWSLSAVDKFAVPYYARTDGAEYAAEMRRKVAKGPVCGLIHLPRSEYMDEGTPTFDGYGAPEASAGEVVEVTMTLRDDAGEERTIRLDGREHDALFWTASAIDKFAVPYYARTDGPEFAAEMRRRAVQGPVCGLIHLPHSEWSGIEDFDGYGAPGDPQARLEVAEVTLILRDGREMRIDGREHDAVFWSLSAIDKFAVPYYARTDGAGYAAEMRRKAAKGPVCAIIHLPRSEWVDEEGGTFDGYGAPEAGAGEVVEVTMTLRDDAGEERTIRLDGREHDALFWTQSAIDKFAVPYYARTDGAEFAAEMRRRAMAAPVCGLVHMPKSAWVTVGEEEFDGYGAPAGSLRVETVTLTIRQGDRTREVRLDGREHDAVFWSLSAIDKFAVPYYARTDGAEYAAEMRRRAARGPVCALVHLPSSEYTAYGEGPFEGYDAPAAAVGEVVEVAMTLRDDAGEERTIRLDGREHDALFWSPSAIDKFAVPYYARTDGAEFAAEMRRRALAGPVCALGHLPWSEYIDIGGDEEFDGYGAPAGSLRVEAVTLTIRQGDRTREVRLDGREHDAVFWSLSAIDKFAVPYYARTDGAEYAAEMRRRAMAAPVCATVHLPWSEYGVVADEPFDGYGAPEASGGEVVEVTMTLRDDAGEERTIRLDGREHDALFWTASAIDKFAVPYYARTDGAEFAAEMRRRALAGPVCALGHMPWSEYTEIGGDEEFDGYGAPAGSLRVEAVTLTIREGGGTREVRLDGREYDSVFWSLSAIDKFAVPYYARTDGAEYAAEMRRKVAKGPVCALIHLPNSEWADWTAEQFDGYGAPEAGAGEVVEVTMTLRDDVGGERTIRLDGREHDALFWTASAIDKFAVPYYARTDGAEFAAEMRRKVMEGPVCGMVHLPKSEYVASPPGESFDGYGAPSGSLRVEAVTLTIREGGGTREVRLDGREYDSVFWSLSAIDKFAVPYYARTDGAEFAARMRRRVLASPLHAIVHLPDTMYDTLDGVAARAARAAVRPAPRPEPVAA